MRVRHVIGSGARAFRIGLAAALVLTVLGCGTGKLYKTGMRLVACGDYDEGIARLEEVVQRKPGKDKYREALAKAKTDGAQWHFVEGRRLYRLAFLSESYTHLRKTLEYDHDRRDAEELMHRVLEEMDQARKLRAEAFDLSRRGEWNDAITRMREAIELYRTLPGGEKDLDKLHRGAARWHVARARDLLTAEQWDAAEAEAQAALACVKDDADASAVIADVRNRRQADRLVSRAQALRQSGRHEEALEKLLEAERLHPDRADLPPRIHAAKEDVCTDLIASAVDALQRKDFAGALVLFRKSKALLPDFGNVDALIDKATAVLVASHLDAAQQSLANQRAGHALMHYIAALGYDSDHEQAGGGARRCVAAIHKRVRYTIGVVGFEASDEHRQTADVLDAHALAHLVRIRPPNVSVMDRADLRKVLEEQNLSMSDLVDPAFRIRTGKLKGLDALIVGRVTGLSVLSESSHTKSRSRYQDGVRYVRNPTYDRAQRDLKRAQRDYERAANSYAATEAMVGAYYNGYNDYYMGLALSSARHRVDRARGKLSDAQATAAATPAHLTRPNITSHTYPVHKVTKTAKLTVSVKVLDTTTAETILAEQITGVYNDSDRYVEGDPPRNVPADPLELPDDAAMREEALKDAIGRLERCVERTIFKHGHRFLVAARKARTAGRSDDALENCLNYLFAYPVGSGKNIALDDYLDNALRDERNMVSFEELLRRHCRILLDRGKLPVGLVEKNDALSIVSFYDQELRRRVRVPCTLTAIQGNAVDTLPAVAAVMSQYGVGDRLTLSILERNRARDIEVQVVP